jgi:hypothetical protein
MADNRFMFEIRGQQGKKTPRKYGYLGFIQFSQHSVHCGALLSLLP